MIPRPWLSEGLAVFVASEVGSRLEAPGLPFRWFRAAQMRGEILPAKQLLAITYSQLEKKVKNWRSPKDAAFYSLLYAQSAGLIRFLSENHEVGLKRFLAGASVRRQPEQLFQKSLGFNVDVAIASWQAWNFAEPLPPYQEPPKGVQERVEAELLPVIGNARASADERIKAIRSLSALGYPWWADILIQTLDDKDALMRTEAQRALENIAGERHPDAAAWRRWLESIPFSARRPSSQPQP